MHKFLVDNWWWLAIILLIVITIMVVMLIIANYREKQMFMIVEDKLSEEYEDELNSKNENRNLNTVGEKKPTKSTKTARIVKPSDKNSKK